MKPSVDRLSCFCISSQAEYLLQMNKLRTLLQSNYYKVVASKCSYCGCKKDDMTLQVTIGVEPEHAEAIYLTLHTTGRIGLTVLPYSDGNYVEKSTKGSVTTLELKNGGIINDVGQEN